MTRSLLLRLRRRILAQAFVQATAWALLGAAGVLAAGALALALMRQPRGDFLAIAGVGLGAMALLGAALWTAFRSPSLQEVAAHIDRTAETRDRLATGLAFGAVSQPLEPLQRAALTECETFLSTFDGRRWIPWRMPRALPWLCLPLLAFCAVQFLAPPPPLSEAKADPAATETARQLEEMARKLEEQHKESAEMKKLAEALKQSAAQLRAQAKGENAEKTRLRELSAIEELMKAAARGNDMEALAAALDQMGEAQAASEAAEALRQRDAETAASKLDEVGKQMGAEGASGTNGDKAQREKLLEQLEKAMAQAAQKLGTESQLGSLAERASRAGQRRDGQGAQQAMSQMGQVLRQSNSTGSGQGRGSQESKELQALMAALREMKSGSSGEGKEGESDAGGGQTVMIAPPGKNGESPGEGMGEGASGQPGSEHDQGTKASPFGQEGAPPAKAEMQAQIQGLLGEGESLHTLLPSKAGEEPAKQGYKALYDAAAPAAEDALEKENIPLGSRLFVKRYFESIRPKQ